MVAMRSLDVSDGGSARLVVRRTGNRFMDWSYFNIPFNVELDGRHIGHVKATHTGEFEIVPGDHRIRLRFNLWQGSSQQRFSVNPDEVAEFSCRLAWSGYVAMDPKPTIRPVNEF
jgi:hypothetical protein